MTSGGDGLAIDVICYVASGKEAFRFRVRALRLQDVAVLIGIHEISQELPVRHMADGHKHALQLERAHFSHGNMRAALFAAARTLKA